MIPLRISYACGATTSGVSCQAASRWWAPGRCATQGRSTCDNQRPSGPASMEPDRGDQNAVLFLQPLIATFGLVRGVIAV